MPKSDLLPAVAGTGGVPIYEFRGVRVVLDEDVAVAFNVETRYVNQARTRHAPKFTDEHAFQLSLNEFQVLRSQSVISNDGRGGRRHPPWVYTVKGVGRLAMILDTPQALAASDKILDLFIEVYRQLARGQTEVAISSPSRFVPTTEDREARLAIRTKLSKAAQALLDSVLHVEEQQALRRTGRQVAQGLREDVIERLRTRGLENEKLSADTELVLAEAQKALAIARKTNAEADGIDLDNLQKRIALVERLQRMYRGIEPDAVVDLLGDLTAKPKLLK